MNEGRDEEQQLLVRLNEEEGIGDKIGDGDVTFVLTLSVFTAVCGSFFCGCSAGYSSPAQSAILSDLGLSMAEYSLFASLLTIGAMLGSLVSGKVTDFIGRRGTMGLSDVLCIAGWLCIAFAQVLIFSGPIAYHANSNISFTLADLPRNVLHESLDDGLSVRRAKAMHILTSTKPALGPWLLDLGRLALGIGNGIFSFVVPVYIAEITPRNLRGGLVLLHQLMICCGMSLAYLVGLVTSWRSLALVGTLPCLIQLLSLPFIPASPRWLAKISHTERHETALQRLRGKNVDISQEAADIRENADAVENISEDNLFSVFQMKYAYALTVSLGLMALAGFGGTFGILFYAAAIFESAGFSAIIGTISLALVQLPPIALGVFLMDNFGRRPLLLYSAAGMGTACLSVAVSFFMKEHGWMTDFSPYLALFGILIFAASFPVGMGGIPYVIMSEIFPINIKGAAGSLATVVNFTSSWIVSYAFNFMMDWSSSGTFLIFTGINVLSLQFIAKLVPETKGRTLEEIQQSMMQPLS